MVERVSFRAQRESDTGPSLSVGTGIPRSLRSLGMTAAAYPSQLGSMPQSRKTLYTPPTPRRLHHAGTFPFTRGIYPGMYTERLWTMRQYAGFGTAEETNARFRHLLAAGQSGLSTAFDLPTQMGYDSDHPMAEGEVGRVGVAIDTVEDLAALFREIPLDKVSTSMTINATAAILLAMYVVVGEEQGVAASKLQGTVQNDVLKEYIARGYLHLSRRSRRSGSRWISSASWRTRSSTSIRSRSAAITCGRPGRHRCRRSAFTLANAIEYVKRAVAAGIRGQSLRASALVLLRGAQRPVRRGGQVPGRPAALGQAGAGAFRRRRPDLPAPVSTPRPAE